MISHEYRLTVTWGDHITDEVDVILTYADSAEDAIREWSSHWLPSELKDVESIKVEKIVPVNNGYDWQEIIA
jgi:hypothetical protein